MKCGAAGKAEGGLAAKKDDDDDVLDALERDSTQMDDIKAAYLQSS